MKEHQINPKQQKTRPQEIEKQIEEIKKIKAISLEESIKIDKSVGRLIRKKKRNNTNIRNER